jgi:hypothetical protein
MCARMVAVRSQPGGAERWLVEMIGSTRSRRVGALLAGAALVVAGATTLRFEVLSSDSIQPLRAAAFSSLAEDTATIFGTVWDGTKSTGPKQGSLPGGFADTGTFGLYIVRDSSLSTPDINLKRALTALDANGKDVGLTCTSG